MRSGIFMLAVAMLTAAMPRAALYARDRLQFEKLERDYQWEGGMRSANKALAQAIPPLTSFWMALDTLKAAGAQCSGDNRDASLAHCVYSQRITIDDYYPADAVWKVSLRLKDGKVGSLSLDREIDAR